MTTSSCLSAHIAESKGLVQWLDSRIDGMEVSSELRFRVAGGCLDMTLEHQKAIVLLVASFLYGSAFSLRRLMFEAYVRGVWLHQCASNAHRRSDAARSGDPEKLLKAVKAL